MNTTFARLRAETESERLFSCYLFNFIVNRIIEKWGRKLFKDAIEASFSRQQSSIAGRSAWANVHSCETKR